MSVVLLGGSIWEPTVQAQQTSQLKEQRPFGKIDPAVRFSRSIESQLARIPFDGQSSFQYLIDICDLGTRMTGSPGMLRQRELLSTHFRSLGAAVETQEFPIRHPETGAEVIVANLIVSWHPETTQRILFCTHYDTRPFPDRDKRNPRGVFIGANDGASGVALLCELGKLMPGLKAKIGDGTIGVDFVFFDAEEFIFSANAGTYFVGSKYFSNVYAADPPPHRYNYGILVDMIGDANLNLYPERNSLDHAEQLTNSIWHVARELNVREFNPQPRHRVNDDHLPLNRVGRIPTCDVIDFDFPRPGGKFSYWHTQQDIVENCCPASLAKVGWVLHEWLKQLK